MRSESERASDMAVSTQKVIGVLRAAGLPIAPRAMLSTQGFQVEGTKAGTVIVCYSTGAQDMGDEAYRALVEERLQTAKTTLEARGVSVEVLYAKEGHATSLVCGRTQAPIEITRDMV